MLLQHHAVQRTGSTFLYELLECNGVDILTEAHPPPSSSHRLSIRACALGRGS